MIINMIIAYFAFIMDAMRLSYWLRRVCRIALGTKIQKIGNAISHTDPKTQFSINITVLYYSITLLLYESIALLLYHSIGLLLF